MLLGNLLDKVAKVETLGRRSPLNEVQSHVPIHNLCILLNTVGNETNLVCVVHIAHERLSNSLEVKSLGGEIRWRTVAVKKKSWACAGG